MTKKKPGAKLGRPLTPLDLPEGWQKDILSMYAIGCSDVEVMAWIWKARESFSRDLWERWLKDEAEFSATIKKGRLLCESWWNQKGRTQLGNGRFSYTGWYMNMKNRFGWRDSAQIDVNTSVLTIKVQGEDPNEDPD